MMISTDLFNHIFERNVNKMKKVINGKMYNTDTAKRMADWYYGCPGDFEYYEEVLYKKKTGEFFLYGEGGPRSKYSDSNGSETYGTCEIIPYSEEQARKWVEEHCSGDTYEEIFGEVEE